MGYARYVGRVGGLAVALGIGVAVATTPGVVLADPSDTDSSNSSTDSPSSSGSSPSGPSAGSPSSSGSDAQSPSSSNSPESPESAGDDEASGDNSDGAAGDEESKGSDTSETDKKSETVKDKKSGSDASTAAVTPKKPKRAVAHTPSDSDVRKGEPAADSSPAVQPKSEPMPQPTVSGVSVDVALQSASSSASTVQDLPKVEPAPEPDVRPLSSTVLSAVGLAPSADGDAPEVPGESPLLLAGLAAFRRQTQQSLVGDEASALKVAEPSQSSLMLASADSGGESLLMAAAVVNSAPSVSPVVGVPDQSSGAVSVSLNAVDAEGNPLTYAVTGQPAGGWLAVDGAGVVTYTPTQVARLAAGSTMAPDFDSFTVSVSDGESSTPVSVSVPVLPAVWTNQSSSSNVTGASPYGVAVVGTTAYVANQGANTVSVINTVTGQTVGSAIVVGSAPTGVVASLDGQYVFVSNRNSGMVSVIRTSDNKVIDINPATPTTVDAIKVGSQPEMLAINTSAITNASGTVLAAAGTRLYVANYASNTVSVIDISNPVAPKVIDTNTATPTTVDAITVGTNPRGIAFAQTVNGPRIYVVNRTGGTVSVIDAVTNKVVDVNPATPTTIDAIRVGTTPQLIVISGDGARAYVSNYGSNSVSIIDTATNKVVDANPATPSTVDAIAVPSTPVGVGLSKDGSLLYVANGNDRISVIDTKTRAVLSTIQIDTAPETNLHTLAVRSDGSLVVTDLADRALRVVAYQRGNTAPVAIANPTVGTTDPSNGAVTGLVNIKDWDGDPLTYTTAAAPSSGSLTYNPTTGTYTYTPTAAARASADAHTVDQFIVRVSDGQAFTDTTPITVPVAPPVGNRAPQAGIPSVGTPDRVTGAVSGSLNFYDPDEDPLTYSVPVQPASGTVTITGSTYTYTPTQAARDAAAASPDQDLATITVFASDGQASTSNTFTVPIAPTPPPNTAPTASPTQAIPNQTTGAITGAVNGADVDGNTLSYSLAGAPPASGFVTLNSATGAFTYMPTVLARIAAHDKSAGPDFDSFTVAVSDGQASTSVTVQVAVLPSLIPFISSTAQTGSNPMGITVSPTKVYVANQLSNSVSVIDRANPTATPVTINVVAAPRAIALSSDGTRAYVAGNGGVSVINLATNQLITTVATSAGDSYGIAVTPTVNGQHRVYVTNSTTNTVRVIDANITANTYTAGASVTVGSGPRGIAVSPDGSRAYVTNWTSNSVSVLDTSTATPALVGSPIAVGTNPVGVVVSPNGARVYVSNYGSASVSVLNPTAATPLVTTITVGAQPFGMAITPDGSIVYAANSFDTVSMIDTKTNSVYSTLTIDDAQPEQQWHSVAVSPDGRQVYISDLADRTVRVATMIRSNSTPTLSTSIVSGDSITGVVSGVVNAKDYDGDSVTVTVVSGPSKGSLTYNASTGAYTYTPSQAARDQAAQTPGITDTFTVRATDSFGGFNSSSSINVTVPVSPNLYLNLPAGVTPIVVGTDPIDMTVAGTRLFVLNSGDGSVSVIDTATKQVVKTIAGLGYSSPMVASKDGRYLYASQYDWYSATASVKVVDTATGGVVATVFMPKCETEGCDLPGGGWANSAGITDIAVSPDGTRVYVSEVWVGDTFYGGTLTMIDTSTNTVVGSVQPSQWGDFYSNIEVSPDGTRIYAGSGYGYVPRMDVLDARTLAGVGYVPLAGNTGWPPPSTGSLTFSSNGERAYVRTTQMWPTYTSQTFAVIDTKLGSPTYNTQIATITVPAGAQYMIVSPDNRRGYVVHEGGKLFTIVDLTTNTVIRSVTSDQVGGDYAALAIGSDGTLYFTNYPKNAVYAVAPGSPLVV